MATPKAYRQAPLRRFENYTLQRISGAEAGLTPIADRAFTHFSGSVGEGYTDENHTAINSIGFDFQIDGYTFNRFVVGTNGWLALVDPAASSFTTGSIFSSGTENASITQAPSANHVLLCPWADDLRNRASVATSVATTDQARRISEGTMVPPNTYDPTDFGVRYFLDQHCVEGNRLIVRWTSLPNPTASAYIKFDAVLYENGKIEFRYPPRNNITLPVTASAGEDATIGVFMNGSVGTWRFRDFSFGLGYNDSARTAYKFGGAVSSSYTDTADSYTVPYTVNLKPSTHWPGSDTGGTTFVFEPPKAKRRVLPRREVKVLDSQPSYPNPIRTGTSRRQKSSLFDDRRTLSFVSGVNVSYPSTLQRSLGGWTVDSIQRQDLFASDFEFTASISNEAASHLMNVRDDSRITPFVENNRPDLHYITSSVATTNFFVSGTGLDIAAKMSSPLSSKTQIKLSLPINHKTTLFGTTASIHYYNTRSKAWLVPFNTTNNNVKTDIATANGAANLSVIDDARGFNALGNAVASASISTTTLYNLTNQASVLHQAYNKSITLNDEYAGTEDEVFTLPINHPFVIEKAVIELPLEAGDTWFADKTTSVEVITTASARKDIGGPALTVALFHQFPIPGQSGQRDLIMSGVITHTFDTHREIVVERVVPYEPTDFAYVHPRGLPSFNAWPAGIINPTSSSTGYRFTGSVDVSMDAAISNGITVFWNATYQADEITAIFQQERTNFGRANDYNIISVNPFGRCGSVNASGRSIFGREFVSSQGFIDRNGQFLNPLYITGTFPTQIQAAISGGVINDFNVAVAMPLEQHFKSPYLVYPGDKLVLAIAKTRPVLFALGLTGSYPQFSGSTHDIKLNTGSVNITLYGSLLQAGAEFHDVLNQPLNSDSVHEAIANDPVLDQFEVEYAQTLSGSYTDDYVTGSMFTTVIVDGKKTLQVTDTSSSLPRGRAFSVLNARSAPTLGSTSRELGVDPWLSSRLRPAWELAGTNRITQHVTSNERYYDSMMPGINDCFVKDSAAIIIDSDGSYYASVTKVDVNNHGFIGFNGAAQGTVNNNKYWQWAYPFEPRYSGVARQKNISKQFLATRKATAGSTVEISPKQLRGFFIGTQLLTPLYDINSGWDNFMFMSDINLSAGATQSTGSSGIDDMARVLFGFGDLATYTPLGTGVNNFPSFRNQDWYYTNSFAGTISFYVQGPIIRGWKYGVYSGLPTYSKARWRRGKFGQFRDMLEQREFTKYYYDSSDSGFAAGEGPAPITVKFVDSSGRLTKPENTSSQNLDTACTSSMPYFDGESRNRPDINPLTLNSSIVQFNQSNFGNITL